jgi:chromate transporter
MDSEAPKSNTKNKERPKPRLGAMFELFLTIGSISFGGGVVAYLKEYLVDNSKWLTDEEFLTALEIGETIPGLISVNLAVIVGDTLRGIPGVIVAVLGMMLPGTILVMTLGILWESQGHNPAVSAFLHGVAASAVGFLSCTFIHIGRKQLTRLPDAVIVLLTFVAIGILRFPLWSVFVTIVPLSIWLYRPAPHRMKRHEGEHLPFHRGSRHHLLRH